MFPPPRPRNLKVPRKRGQSSCHTRCPGDFYLSQRAGLPRCMVRGVSSVLVLECPSAVWSGPAAPAATWALYNKSHGCQVSRAAWPFISTPEFGRLGTICLGQPESLCGPRTNKRPCDELCPLKHLRDKDAGRQSAAYMMRPRHAVRHWVKYCSIGHSVVGATLLPQTTCHWHRRRWARCTRCPSSGA